MYGKFLMLHIMSLSCRHNSVVFGVILGQCSIITKIFIKLLLNMHYNVNIQLKVKIYVTSGINI